VRKNEAIASDWLCGWAGYSRSELRNFVFMIYKFVKPVHTGKVRELLLESASAYHGFGKIQQMMHFCSVRVVSLDGSDDSELLAGLSCD
jgi:hypothetical protein